MMSWVEEELDVAVGTWHIDAGVLAHAGEGLVVVGTSDLETLTLEDDAIESHGLGRLVHRAELRTEPKPTGAV